MLHVDYWDDIGWKDVFARRARTDRRYWLSNLASSRVVYGPEPEHTDYLRQLLRLILQGFGGCGRLFHQRRVLLCHGVHLADRYIDLRDSGGRFVTGGGDFADDAAERPILATMSFMVAPVWSTRWAPGSTWCTESSIRALISFATAADRCAGLNL